MQKIGLFTAVIIWLLLAGRLINNKIEKESDVVSAFSAQEFVEVEGSVAALGEYGVTYLSDEEKKALLESVAYSMGIESDYEIIDENNGETIEKILVKKGKNADTVIKVVTIQTDMGVYYQSEQYVSVNINLGNGIEGVLTCRNLVEDVFETKGIKGNVTVNLQGKMPGMLTYAEKNNITNALLQELDADVVSENRGNDLFTVYAYSDSVQGSVICAGKKVNINISEDYNELENMTTIYLSTPLNNLDY